VKDVFGLAGNDELAEAEKRYLPATPEAPRAVILAASRGVELGELTADRPKCMIDVRGQPLLKRMVDTLNGGGVRDITVVRGYHKEMVNLPTIRTVDNDMYQETGEATTLACAEAALHGETILAYGDVLFRQYILDRLRAADGDVVLAVDALWRERDPDPFSRTRDMVACAAPFRAGYLDEDAVAVREIAPDLGADDIDGEWIGVARLSENGAAAVRAELAAMREDGALRHASLIDLLQRLVRKDIAVSAVYIAGHWLDIDNPADLKEAGSFL
jgi:phosphoenolpyruvate phosphomutase